MPHRRHIVGQSGFPRTVRRSAKSRHGTTKEIRLEPLGDLGKGAFGRVKKMRVTHTEGDESKTVAVKNPTKTTRTRTDVTEKDLLVMLKHKNIVDLLYYYREGETVNVVLELVEGGDLYSMIRKNFNKTEGIGIYAEVYVYQLFRGLAYLHSRRVAHRDIKPENLLVNEKTGELKIADFGLGTLMAKDDTAGHAFYVGTRYYRSVEMLLGCRHYRLNIDVWAGGVVLTQVLLGKPLFYEKGMHGSKALVRKMFEYLGPPTHADFRAMQVKPMPLPVINRKEFLSAFANVYVRDRALLDDLLKRIFVYNFAKRHTPWRVCNHRLFDILKESSTRLPNGNPLPKLFDFSTHEIKSMSPKVRRRLAGEGHEQGRMPGPATAPVKSRKIRIRPQVID